MYTCCCRNGSLGFGPPSCGGAPIDLLGDILKGQDLLSRKSEEITINRDGMYNKINFIGLARNQKSLTHVQVVSMTTDV